MITRQSQGAGKYWIEQHITAEDEDKVLANTVFNSTRQHMAETKWWQILDSVAFALIAGA